MKPMQIKTTLRNIANRILYRLFPDLKSPKLTIACQREIYSLLNYIDDKCPEYLIEGDRLQRHYFPIPLSFKERARFKHTKDI